MTTKRDPLDIAAIEARCAAVKSGPFEVWCDGNVYTANYVSRENAIRKLAKDDAPALLAEVRRLQADNERMRRGIVEIENLSDDTEVEAIKACVLIGSHARNLLAGREWSEGE